MKILKYYKIFDAKNDMPHTLFHGVQKSRLLPLDEWITAEVKNVSDGSAGKVYRSGFHVLKHFEETKNFFMNQFRIFDHRVISIIDVDVDSGIWPKKHSRGNVFLAKKIRINKKEWDKRIYMNKLEKG